MAERIPPGVVNYRPYDFMELEPLILIKQRIPRYYFVADNAATRIATAKDELGELIPEIDIIRSFFLDPKYTGTAALLNRHIADIRDVSPLYVAMQLNHNGAARAGRLVGFTNTDTGVQPILKTQLSVNLGLPPIGASYAEHVLIQKTGPANIRPGRRR